MHLKEALLYETLPETDEVICRLCAHYCKIRPGSGGICRIRFNRDGKLYSYTWGRAESVAIDPIEKKPFYHFKPKTNVLSFGTPGCNFKCVNCQNSYLSQSIKFKPQELLVAKILHPIEIVQIAKIYNVDGISYTYSEPTIFFEYARDIINESRRNPETSHLFHIFVSNGYFSKEMLKVVVEENLLQAINIDLKFFNDKKYLKITGGHLKPVLESIERVFDAGIHIEVINLVIPGENDNDESFEQISKFLASISTRIPLHFSRFYPSYKMIDRPSTSLEKLLRAKQIAESNGMQYVYIGNTDLPEAENTYCPFCNFLLVERQRYFTTIYYNKKGNKGICPNCGNEINIVV